MTVLSPILLRSSCLALALLACASALADNSESEAPFVARHLSGQPEYFEAGLSAGFKDAQLLGFYLLGPAFWNLRPGVEFASRSSDKTRDDGTLDVRNDLQSCISISSRTFVTQEFFWETKFGVGWHDQRGRYITDSEDKRRRLNLFYSEFETAVGISQRDTETPAHSAWIVSVAAGASLRQNYRPVKAFITEEQERLRSGTTGVFVRLGIGI